MNPRLFVVTISFYLVSLAASLIASFFTKHIPVRVINAIVIIHFIALLSWIFLRDASETVLTPGLSNYLFLSFICSGVLISTILLRMLYPWFMKTYFALFLVTLPVFMITPSRLLGFIVSGNPYAVNPLSFHLVGKYYLVELPGSSPANSFKLVSKMGIFHKTLARNVVLTPKTDSVHLLQFRESESVSIRIFSKEGELDSTDIVIPLDVKGVENNQITRKQVTQP